jgi:glucose/arabinose dehydrogenase
MKYLCLNKIVMLGVLCIGLAACGGEGDGASVTTTTGNSPSAPPQPSQPSPPPEPPPPPSVPPNIPAIRAQSATNFPSSPVRVFFSLANFTIGAPGAPHMRFSIDGGPLNDFFVGTGNDPDVGVQLNGVHTHFAHWISPTSFHLFGLAAGSHSVRFTLVDGFNNELPNSEAEVTYNFTVQQPPAGNLGLQSVLGGLQYPVSLVESSDGRIFFNELYTGNVRVINSNWQLDPTAFCSVSVQTNGEQGLLGLALDPNFSSNQTLYVYYTASATTNRVSRLVKQANGSCMETQILSTIPAKVNHNGGGIIFGPDGRLYITIGDVGVPSNAQSLDSLAGKVLRITTDGSPAPGNPFSSNPNVNTQRVYSLGHRNSFGITFHPSTGHLWESENGAFNGDEVNRIVAGGNYGWPIAGGMANHPSYRNPSVEFTTAIAPTGIVGIPSNSAVYPPPFRGGLLVAAFVDGTIRLVTPNGTNPDLPGTATVAYPGGASGLFSLLRASDGYVYASTADSIFRVVVNSH